MGSMLFFSLNSIKPQRNYDGGSITNVTSDEVSGFENISLEVLKLNKGGSLEPIWHPNAHKIGYCLEGSAVVSIRTPSSIETFTIKEGDMFFIPEGDIYQIANSGERENKIIFAFSHSMPETMHLLNAVYTLSDSVFASTFNTPPSFFDGIKEAKKWDQISSSSLIKKPTQDSSSPFKFSIAESAKPITTKGGYLQIGTKVSLPTLKGLGILRFGLNPKGAVEPHWHTNAGELIYIVKGSTRITVLSPDNCVEVLEVREGEGAFAPASHFHNIENIGNDEVEVIAFFSHADPNYIGIGEVLGSYSNEALASIFHVAPNYFDSLTKPKQPLVIVPI